MKAILLFSTLALFLSTSCKKDEVVRLIDLTYQPDITPVRFLNSTEITNTYFPAPVGKTYIYEGHTGDGLERIEEKRLTSTKTIQSIECVIVNFKAYLNGILIEEAFDWYAQDNDGTVWYFGEAVDNYNPDGTFKDHAGSWEAGVDGAKPGIIMPANPTLGLAYREEYYFNEAEDEAEITSVNLNVSIPFGIFTNCIRTSNWTELEPDANENKFYAPGIGLVKEENVTDGEEILLISIQ